MFLFAAFFCYIRLTVELAAGLAAQSLALPPDMRADMPLYFFHLRDGVDILIDEEGRQLEGVAAVAKAALFEARSIISADAQTGHIRLDQRIDVEDEARTIVHTIEFADAITIVPAAGA